MNGFLNRVVSILERRFLLVSFLPVLIFVAGFGLLITAAGGHGRAAFNGFARLSASLQILLIISFLAAVWLLAGFVDSQLRNLTSSSRDTHSKCWLPGCSNERLHGISHSATNWS